MALIAAHLNAGIILVVTSAGQGAAQKARKRDIYNHLSSASTYYVDTGWSLLRARVKDLYISTAVLRQPLRAGLA